MPVKKVEKTGTEASFNVNVVGLKEKICIYLRCAASVRIQIIIMDGYLSKMVEEYHLGGTLRTL